MTEQLPGPSEPAADTDNGSAVRIRADEAQPHRAGTHRPGAGKKPSPDYPHRTLVQDVMVRQVVAVDPRAGFARIVSALQQHHHDMLPVVDGERHVMGMVCASDLLAKLAVRALPPRWLGPESRTVRTLRRKAAAVEAGELMTTPAVTVDAHTTVEEAALVAARHRIHHLPVIDRRRRLVGIVCLCDLLNVLRRDDSAIRAEVKAVALATGSGTVASTLRVDCVRGRVTLDARTARRSQARQLRERVQAIEGVVDVASDLRWEIDDLRAHFPVPS